jgi:hypothetical protein
MDGMKKKFLFPCTKNIFCAPKKDECNIKKGKILKQKLDKRFVFFFNFHFDLIILTRHAVCQND